MRPDTSFIEQPVRSLQTMLRVLSEDDKRIPTVVPDGIYGPTTMQSVSAFQRINGIQVTGVTDQYTWEQIVLQYDDVIIRVGKAEPIEIVLDPNQVFRYGDSSPYIYLLQSMLTQLSFDNPSIITPDHSGVMDESTVQSLAEFQKLSGIPETGEFDKVTWKYLVHQFTLNAHNNSTKNER